MLKRIISICIAMIISVMLCANVFAAVAQIDYSQEIEELQDLMEQCKNKGIPTDYEMVNYSVISRFEDYINSDINNASLSDEILQYNIECMNELYNEAKENLTSYLNGTKTPLSVVRNDMDSFDYDDGVLNDKNGPLFSVGYGHFSEVMNTVPELNDFGTDNIQIEISPNTFFQKNIKGWNVSYSGGVDATVELIDDNNNTKLKIVNNSPKDSNVFVAVSQTVSCSPSTTYNFGGDIKYLADENFWISVNGFDVRNYISPVSESQTQEFKYQTSATQTTMTFMILLEVTGELEIDNIYIKKANSSVNLLSNGDFEEGYDYLKNIEYVKETLNKAEQYNVGVNLLLSPHSFPTDLGDDLYHDADYMFIKYNIDAEATRAKLKEYLDGVLPELKGYKALKSICLSNEPVYDTRKFADFYNPKFRDYLRKIHGTIDELNEAWGTTSWYNKNSDFSDISIRNVSLSLKTAMNYEWIEFNDKVFTDWHKWMADIVNKHLPEIPLHTKMMNYFDAEDDNVSDRFARGTDLELFAEFSDFTGNDAHNYIDDISSYYEMMFLYDYQLSATNMPVYNSEEHIIEDNSNVFSENQRKHWRNTLWQGMIHGRSMTSIWTWERILNSVLHRPDIAAETGKTSLDIMRFADEISAIQQNNSGVALFYSKASRFYQTNYSEKLFEVYKALLELGIKPAIVSDKSIEKITDYSVLIIPNAINCETETSEYIKSFCDNGGKLIYSGDIFSKNKYNKTLANKNTYSTDYKFTVTNKDDIKEVFSQYFEELGINKVKLIDKETGAMPDMVDWNYCINGNNLLINITNLEFDTTKELSVIYDGYEVIDLECLLSGEIVDSVTAEGYTPILLKYQIEKDGKLSNLFIDRENATINWQCNTPVKIYMLSKDGTPEFLKKTAENKYEFTAFGNYIVTPITCEKISDGEIITITDNKPFDIKFLEVNKSDEYINCTIEIKNISNEFATAEFVLKAKNDSGTVASSIYKITLRGGTKTQYSVSLPVLNEVSDIELEAFDSCISKNSNSDCIKYNF